MIGWLRRGQIDAFWLDNTGDFQSVRRSVWGLSPARANVTGVRRRHNAHRRTADAALRQFGVAPGYFRGSSAEPPPAGPRLIYVRPDQVLRQLVELNPAAAPGFPDQPIKSIHTLSNAELSEVKEISILAALAWIATRDVAATAGAMVYPGIYKGGPGEGVAYAACENYLKDQIANFYCGCRKATCGCWNDAIDQLKAAVEGSRPTVVGRGYRGDEGDEEEIPSSAWRGTLSYDTTCWLEPPRPNGTRWGSVAFNTSAILTAFPVAPLELAPHSPFDRKAALQELAVVLERDGIRKGIVRAPDIKDRWPAEGGAPPGVKEVLPLMSDRAAGRRPAALKQLSDRTA